RAFGGDVQPVDVVKPRGLEERCETGADRIRPFPRSHLRAKRRASIVAKRERDLERGVAQGSRNDSGVSEQTQITVGERCQAVASRTQVMRRAAVSDEKAQNLPETKSLFLHVRTGIVGRPVQEFVNFVEIGAVPCP